MELISSIDRCRYSFRSVCWSSHSFFHRSLFANILSAKICTGKHTLTHIGTHAHRKNRKNTNASPSVLDWFAVDLTLSKAVETRFGQPMRKLMRINSWPLW